MFVDRDGRPMDEAMDPSDFRKFLVILGSAGAIAIGLCVAGAEAVDALTDGRTNMIGVCTTNAQGVQNCR